MKPKIEIIKKIIKRDCGCGKDRSCKTCGGKGKYEDYQYYHIVGKYCYDGDLLK